VLDLALWLAYVETLVIGARDMAFPRLNSFELLGFNGGRYLRQLSLRIMQHLMVIGLCTHH